MSTALGLFGRASFALGLFVLAFVAFQLWGTGASTDRAQDELAGQLERAGDQPQTVATLATELTGGDAEAQVVAEPIPVEVDTAEVGDGDDTPAIEAPPTGDPVGTIRIPSIGVEQVIVEGVGVDELATGPGRYPSSALPGEPGNLAVAGHRTTYGAPFGDIDRLVPGEVIEVESPHGTFEYRVLPQGTVDGEEIGHVIVRPEDTYVILDYGDNRITLTACHPKFSARQRIVVHAELVSDEPRFPDQ